MTLRIGSLFSGYGGLDMAVEEVTGGRTAWFVEFDKAPSKILAHHWPDVPNYGDITKVKWLPECPVCNDGRTLTVTRDPDGHATGYFCAGVDSCTCWFSFADVADQNVPEPVDIFTGGSPCQDLSHAGKRSGMTEGTRSNLWVQMREAIAALRPSLVIWENVRGAYSAAADSDVEPCEGCLGEGPDQPVLRALGRVLGDLAELGFDAGWHGLRAADVGAPHPRFRVFVAARLTDSERSGRFGRQIQLSGLPGQPAGDSAGALLPTPTSSDTNGAGAHGDGGLDLRTAVSLLPTPRATDGTKGGPNQRGSSGDLMLPSAVTLLPTPAVNDMGEGKTVDAWDEWTTKMQAAHGNGNGHGKSLAIEAQRLLPTPTTQDAANNGGPSQLHRNSVPLNAVQDWGIYAEAIARWEALTRPAPAPTQPSKKGTPQLSPAFSEWLMGLPEGHVTGVPGLSRNDQLKALGNGVVPQQAAAALRFLFNIVGVAA